MDWDDFDQFNDIDDLAALISCLDLVVSTDNSTVHLSGALGVETWVLLSTQCEWRWTDSGSQSYWYRAVKTIRQSGANEWGPVMEQVVALLGEKLRTRRG
jgi:ADP-heptose:LPS heptosyltransferase